VDERGQASVEWVGVVALVAALLAVVLALALPGDGVGAAVVRQIHRALCIVGGGVCDLDRRPCVLTSGTTRDRAHVTVFSLRVGRDELIVYERLSDGRVLVTYLGDTRFGIDVGAGADAWLKAAGAHMSAGRSARAALLAAAGGGETWLFDDAFAADAGMAALSEGHDPPRGRRAEWVDRRGLGVELDASAGRGKTSGALGLEAGMVRGTIVDERDGSRIHVLERGIQGEAVLSRKDDGAHGRGAADERISVRTDAAGRPLELAIVRTGELEGAYSLPDRVQPIAQELTGGSQKGRRWVVEQRLDLTDPLNRQAAQEYVEAIRLPTSRLGGAAQALRDRIAASGVIETRTYGVAYEHNGGGRVSVGGGLRFGAGISDETEETRLLDARVQGPDGRWRARRDCLEPTAA